MQEENHRGKVYYRLACALALVGFLSGFFFQKELHAYHSVFGLPVRGLFVPPSLCLFFILYTAWKRQMLYWRHFMMSLLIFLSGMLPLKESLLQDVHYNWWDDGYRYSLCAHNMVDHQTLWGGDRLVARTDDNIYAFQAGYRYFLALELLILRHENRLFQIINLSIWCLVVSLLVQSIQKQAIDGFLYKVILCFLFGASIYATKNILMGLSEWCCILLLMLQVIFMQKNNIMVGIVFLALAVFIRQNQLPAVFVFFLLSLALTNRKPLAILLFIAILLMPVYHNLYYAHRWTFFYNYKYYPILIPVSTGSGILDFLIMTRNTALHYLGFDWQRSLTANLFGIIFIPTGVLAAVYMFRALRGVYRSIFIFCLLMILSSSIILNYAYFPRFEFANFFCMLTGFLIIWQLQVRSVNLKKYFPFMFRSPAA
jgi:hypothetical protein